MTLSADVPLLLLPVRIETRFVDTGEQSSLLLRIYPDTINVSSFELELTSDEIAAGIAYWDLVWRAGNPPPNEDALRAPWRALASRYTPQRAAWIARTMTPTNLAAQPVPPTPSGGTPSPQPVYPSPPTRPSSWEKAPMATALPDAWTVLLYQGTTVTTRTSSPIVPDLAVGLTPNDGTFPDGLPVDAAMRWLVDFDAAVNAGMALRIPLTADARATGFERILVFGTRSETQDSSGVATLQALLDAHHYTDGLAFVPQGAPTNNTPDATSAYWRKDPQFDTSFAVERGAGLNAATDSDGALAAALLGVAPETFAHVDDADGYGVRNGHDMMIALWPSTLGYFLDQMMASVFTVGQIETARQYARDNAVPRGLLPALRTGKTPYGVLPVTSLRAYPSEPLPLGGGNAELALVQFLKRLLPAWLSSSAGAPHVNATNDPDVDLTAVLGMDASSMTFHGRRVLGDDALWNLLLFFGLPSAPAQEWWLEHWVRGRALLDSLGFGAWDPRVIRTSMGEDTYAVPFPTVQEGPLSETDPLKNDATIGGKTINYIQWLNSAPIDDIRAENYPGPKPASLLYRILRQSMLLDYVTLAGREQVREGVLPQAALRETEMVNVATAQPPTITPWEILAQPVAAQPSLSWAEYLRQLDPAPNSPFARLAELRASFDRLASLPTAELDRLLTETLDACSHRIDVWVTAVANAMLQRTRAGKQNDTHLGAYGWVENVRPAARRATVTGTELRRVEELDARRSFKGPVPYVSPTDNGGYIHAPSLTQAAAAAVLRNGYMTHRYTADAGLLSIDLSSERVRRALWILEGIRQGQRLGALLGYRFEAGLHAGGLDKYTQPFRDRFPLIGDKLTAESSPGAYVSASDVVDAVALRTAWDSGALPRVGNWGTGLPAPGADRDAVIALFADLDDTMDALGDLSLAEETYQLIRGNFGRAGGAMDAISRGLRPPEIQIVETPRSGTDFTQRMMLLFAGAPAPSPLWTGIIQHPRAMADPALDAWLGSQLPDPAIVLSAVTYEVGGASTTVIVSLASLDLGPLDVLALSDTADQPARSELELRIIARAAPPANALAIEIRYASGALPAGSITFPDFLAAAVALRDLVRSARPLRPQDCTLPETNATNAGGVVDLADLNARAGAIRTKIAADIAALQNALASIVASPGGVRTALLQCSYYGVTGSIPQVGATTDGLAAQATSVLGELQRRLMASQQVALPATMPADATTAITAILSAPVVPQFTPPDLASLQAAFGQSATLGGSDEFAVPRWITQMSHVRPAMERFDFAASVTQALTGTARSPLTLAQLPQTANDRWLALPLAGTTPAQGRVAIAALAVGDPTMQSSYAGLLIDEWPERIPSGSESAAVAFHYEEPKARAPQAALLALCPVDRETWDPQILQMILEETLDLAKIRTVDVDSILEVGQILPALYFALNMQGATISTHFVEREVRLP